MKVENRRFGILGMARSGISAAAKIKELGGIAFISEYKNETEIANSKQIKDTFLCEFGGHTIRLLDNDVLILSPGIPGNIPILKEAEKQNIEIISEIEFSFRIKHPHSKIIAITGSNGKSTTVSLIHHILQTAEYNSILAGNIGTAFSSYPIEKEDIDFVVLELSSFQLELIDSFKADVAAILNITPDHLDRYDSFENYAETKFNIFMNQNTNDLAIINMDDIISAKFIDKINSDLKYFSPNPKADIYSKENSIIFSSKEFSIQKAAIQGPHNIANIMCAILAVSPFNIKKNIIQKSLKTFSPLAHRMEFVIEVDGIKFYNDSKATNTDSVKYALQSFNTPIRIIMGGAGKGEDYSILIPYLKEQAKKVYLTGDTIDEMKKVFEGSVEIESIKEFENVIKKAFIDSKNGDIIVLSPACTSYDRFKNFEERGNTFKEIVSRLKK
ncbi:MAG: UDP-N-acetylmuramoyl-L-alanine--D-glutamate ligase [Candidatus Cloacimonadota bacterium]|nr:UDP-N-acetylmuramoyl-L-alanine--D-glutamate ligase [Candidatus Cloacimonadota bacterium]